MTHSLETTSTTQNINQMKQLQANIVLPEELLRINLVETGDRKSVV